MADTTPTIWDDLDPLETRAPLIHGATDFKSLTDAVARPMETKPPLAWWVTLALSLGALGLLGISVAWLFWEGVGVWGLNNPVGWGFDITNFVFWIGIGHAGTLISAILYLFRQKWRTSINRFAEAMTLFAVACALLFPSIHVGRVWLLYYVFPIPNQMNAWPNFRSPLLWDVFAVSIYGSVSLMFWFMGLIPDLATMRDRSTGLRQKIYGALALGWRGSFRHWWHYERAYLILAALSTPLVLSVHSIVSFDFATSQIPGWHTTIFPPYFVAGAVFSGFGMVVTLMVLARKLFGLEHLVTVRHFENMGKVMLVTGSIVGYAYMIEFFMAWYSGNHYERYVFINRAFGPYWFAYWAMFICNVVTPQLFWIKWFRKNIWAMFVISLFVNVGMWFERFVIIVTSLHRDFLPSAWAMYYPTKWEVFTFIGSFGLFFFLTCLFVRFVPMVALAELKGVTPAADPHPPSAGSPGPAGSHHS